MGLCGRKRPDMDCFRGEGAQEGRPLSETRWRARIGGQPQRGVNSSGGLPGSRCIGCWRLPVAQLRGQRASGPALCTGSRPALAPPAPTVLNLAWLAALGFALCGLLVWWRPSPPARQNSPCTRFVAHVWLHRGPGRVGSQGHGDSAGTGQARAHLTSGFRHGPKSFGASPAFRPAPAGIEARITRQIRGWQRPSSPGGIDVAELR